MNGGRVIPPKPRGGLVRMPDVDSVIVAGDSDRPLKLAFTASVPSATRAKVESLFYFNPRQGVMIAQIRAIVEETGAPCIVEKDDRIWIGVPAGTTQCLFACSPPERPIGVALYSRPTAELIRILHLAIEPSLPGLSRLPGDAVAAAMVNRIRQIAGRIKGVHRVQLPYRSSSFLRVPTSR